MRNHVGVASKMFRVLSEEGISIQMISASEIKTSVVIDEKNVEGRAQPAQGIRVGPGSSLNRQKRSRIGA